MSLLTLGGTDIHVITGIYLNVVSGFFEPPQLRGQDYVIPGVNGRVAMDRRADLWIVRLDGYVIGPDAGDWNDNTTTLMALLDGSSNDLVIDDGYLGTSDTWTLPVRCVEPPVGNLMHPDIQWQPWSIELEALSAWVSS